MQLESRLRPRCTDTLLNARASLALHRTHKVIESSNDPMHLESVESPRDNAKLKFAPTRSAVERSF